MSIDWFVVASVVCGVLVAASPWWYAGAGVRARLADLAWSAASSDRLVEQDGPVEIGVLLELLAAAVRAGTSVPQIGRAHV